jgi:hypothetical protein
MRCKTARKAFFEDGLGLLADGPRAGLEQHCRACASCSDAWRASTTLDGSFKALRSRPVPAVDIRYKVLDRIGTGPPPAPQRFAWALAGAMAAAAGFVTFTFLLVPHALPLLRAALHGGGALVRSATPLWTLGSALVQIGSVLTRPLLSLGAAFGAVMPLAWTFLITGACLTLTVSLVVVGRSFLLQRPAVIRKEP